MPYCTNIYIFMKNLNMLLPAMFHPLRLFQSGIADSSQDILVLRTTKKRWTKRTSIRISADDANIAMMKATIAINERVTQEVVTEQVKIIAITFSRIPNDHFEYNRKFAR